MSNLQITCVILGVIVIIAIFIYNYWYAVQHTPRKARLPEAAEQEARSDRKDPSLPKTHEAEHPHGASLGGALPDSDSPQAAAFHGPAGTPASAAALAADYDPLDQALDAEYRSEASVTGRATAHEDPQEMDALVFSITQILLDAPILGEAAMSAQPPTRRIGSKPLRIEGLNLQTKTWETPRPKATYGEFQMGVLLANRMGALNEIEFSEFIAKAQTFADAVGGSADCPDMIHEVARAREVDAFAAQNDAVLSFMVIAQRAAWSPGYINQLAKELGFDKTSSPGRLVVHAARPHSPPVLVLHYDPQAALADDLDHAPIHEITLTLDVPNVDRSENAFARLRSTVEDMADTMDGIVASPDGRPLPAMAMEPIASDLEQLYNALESRGIPAGSPAAQKLFS